MPARVTLVELSVPAWSTSRVLRAAAAEASSIREAPKVETEVLAERLKVLPPRVKRELKRLVLEAVVEKREVVVAWVKMAVEGVEAPMGVLLIVPPEMVRSSATRASAKVPNQVGVKVWVSPTEVMVKRRLASGEEVAKVWEEPVWKEEY